MDEITALSQAIANLTARLHRLETAGPRMPSSQTPTLINGWANVGGGYAPASYHRFGYVVYLAGRLTGGALNTAMFTLPLGYRPVATMAYSVLGGTVEVRSNGEVVPVSGATPFSLDGLVFRV